MLEAQRHMGDESRYDIEVSLPVRRLDVPAAAGGGRAKTG
jgi:hypothetical protein